MLKLYQNQEYTMQNSSPDIDPTRSSILYNDSGYFTNHNPEVNSLSSNSNSDPSFEVCEDISLHSKTDLPLQPTSGIYFCEDAVFDEPKLEGPPLLNNYEQFSSLIKFSLEETSNSYLSNDYSQNKNVLQYFNQDSSLSSLSSINPSQPILVTEENKQNIVHQAAEECIATKSEVITPEKHKIDPNLSPELFSEEEDPIIEIETSLNASQTRKTAPQSDQFLKNDRQLLKRVQETLNGVPPPPSVTILQITVSEMLEKIYSNKHLFLSVNKDETNSESVSNLSNSCTDKKVKSLMITSTKEEVEQNQWPDIMNLRYHGLYYNRSAVSEELEQQCSRYSARYVGSETTSSCAAAWGGAGAAASRRPQRGPRWAPRSPGRRLSHLARRRITFSSANLQQQSKAVNNHRLVIDTRKPVPKVRRSPRKSPWKRSPRKSPLKKIRTPGSSRKLGSHHVVDASTAPHTSKMSSTKRALFQSPEHDTATAESMSMSMSMSTSTSAAQRPRRALFYSPAKNGDHGGGSNMKRTTSTTTSDKPRRALFNSPSKNCNLGITSTVQRTTESSSASTSTSTSMSSAQRPRRALFNSPSKNCDLGVSSTAQRMRRSLFTSPMKMQSPTKTAKFTSSDLSAAPSSSSRPRRSLFSSPTAQRSPLKKRKRCEDVEDVEPLRKLPRSQSCDVQRASDSSDAAMPRRNSEVISGGRGELSELHKQKLLWAVSTALRLHAVRMSHPRFRSWAAVLCRVVKPQVLDLVGGAGGARPPGSTSDRLLRLARRHVHQVTQGHTSQQILQDIHEQKLKTLKAPKGYVPPDSVLKDKVMNIQPDKAFESDSKLNSIKRQILFEDNR